MTVFGNFSNGGFLTGGGSDVPDPIIPGDGDLNITGDLSVSGDVSGATATITGDLSIGTGGQILADDGSVSAPGISFGSAANTGLFVVGENLYFATSGGTRAYMTAASLVVGSRCLPTVNDTFDLGADGTAWKDLYLSGDIDCAGDVTITEDSGGVGGVAVGAFKLENTVDATAGEPERWAPGIIFEGSAWETTGGSADQHEVLAHMTTADGASTRATFQLRSRKNGGAFTTVMFAVREDGFVLCYGGLAMQPGDPLYFDSGFGHEKIISPSDGILDLYSDNTKALSLGAGGAATFIGDVTIGSGGQIFVDDGDATNPAIAPASDPDTGIFFDTAQVRFSVAAGNAMRCTTNEVQVYKKLTMDAELAHEGSTVGFFGSTPVVRTAAYTVTNVTPDRAYDANTSNVAELADVLGTLIADLQSYGLLQ